MYQNLTAEAVAVIAERYGFEPDERAVIANAQQADQYHGTPCPGFDGNLKRFWGCDAKGRYDAERLLDGYLSETAREAEADGLAHAQFCRDAYGSD